MSLSLAPNLRRVMLPLRFLGAFVWGLGLLINFIDFSLASDDFSLPLTLTNTTDVDYVSEPVTSGIPLSESLNIMSSEQFVITRQDRTQVPAQFRVLARYGSINDKTKPIKWILVDFQADVSAKGSSTYFLKKEPRESFSGITTTITTSDIVVNTGTMTLAVPRSRFNLFSSITLLDQDTPAVLGDGGSGIVIEKGGKTYSSFYDDSPAVSVEESGAMRTVIKAKGRFKSQAGELLVGGDARVYLPQSNIKPKAEGYPLTYTVRIHAYKGKSYLKVVYTLENEGNTLATYYPVNDVFLDGNYLKFRPSSLTNHLIVATANTTSSVEHSDILSLFQNHKVVDEGDESKNFFYTVSRNDKRIAYGNRSDGWMQINDVNKKGLMISMRTFWQNYEKEIIWKDGYLQLGVFPDHHVVPESEGPFTHYSSGNHYFSGGWHKTSEILLYPFNGLRSATELIRQVTRFQNPLFAKCSKEWYAISRAWSLIAPAHFPTFGLPELTRDALSRYEDYIGMFVDETKDAKNHLTVERLREARGWWPNSKADWYGWENFGDMSWGTNIWCGLVYDWPHSFWLHYMRTNDERYRILAKEATDHHIDLDLVKIYDGSPYVIFGDGTWMWETEGGKHVNNHHKATSTSGFAFSHTWNGGYTLGYLLTGDYRYLEAVQRTAKAVRRFYSTKGRDCIRGEDYLDTQTRCHAWSILLLVNEYRVSGNLQNLRDAMNIFIHSLLYMEQLPEFPGSNGQGYILFRDTTYDRKCIVTFLTYPLEPLCELHYEASNAGLDVANLESYLQRSLNWLKNFAYVGGDTNAKGHYSLLTISYATDPFNPERNMGGTLAHNILVAGAFGYMSEVLKSKHPDIAADYLTFARKAFKDLMLYKVEKKAKDYYHDPKTYSPVGWDWLPTMPKEMGYIGRGGQFYLHSEYLRLSIKQTYQE